MPFKLETAAEEHQRRMDHTLRLANEIADLRCALADALGVLDGILPEALRRGHARRDSRALHVVHCDGAALDLERARELCRPLGSFAKQEGEA